MDNNLDLYCQTFIDTKMDEKEIIKWIQDFIKGKTVSIDAHIKNNFLDIQINSNEDYDEVRKMEKKSGFLFYPFYLDIFPSEKVNQNDYIVHIKELFFFLRGKNCTVVPACDFEDELEENLIRNG